MWLFRQVEKRYLLGVDGFIWNSRTTRRVVEGVVGKGSPGVVAYPAGDRLGGLEVVQITLRSQEARPLRLLFVGSLIPRKGLHTLISALQSLKLPAWTLRIVGRLDVDPVYSRRVRRQVEENGLSDRIQFLGNLPEAELAKEFKIGQLLVMVSEYEGFGIVYLEGMSFGLPAIASTAGAAGEIIQDGVNGRLVVPGHKKGLAEAIRPYLEDRGYLQSQSLAARKRFLEFPTWDQSAATIRQFLLDTLESWKERKP
jgi:glycosyltransferase involved in cell wall biosynthesis